MGDFLAKTVKRLFKMETSPLKPIAGESFMEALRTCKGLLCSAGFEAPAEALYLGKETFCNSYKRPIRAGL